VKWYIVGWMLLGVLFARPVSAQSLADQGPIADRAQKISVIVWAASVTADQITTYRFSSRYRDMMHE